MTISRVPWHFVSVLESSPGVPAYDFYVDVPGQIQWSYSVNGHLAEDPLGGPPVQISRSTGTFPRQEGTLTLGAFKGADRNAQMQRIMQAWFHRGPFYVTEPGGITWFLMFKAVAQPGLTQQWQGANRLFQTAVYEVPPP